MLIIYYSILRIVRFSFRGVAMVFLSQQSQDSDESNLLETATDTRRIYEGRILNVREDTEVLANGRSAKREVVEHAQAVVVLPVESLETIYLIRQFRHSVGNVLLEAPAGMIEAEEDPLLAAQRELREETGLTATDWHSLGGTYMAPGFCDEYIHYFVAKGLTTGDTDLDPDEQVSVGVYAYQDLLKMLDQGGIQDAKTGLLLMWAHQKGLL